MGGWDLGLRNRGLEVFEFAIWHRRPCFRNGPRDVATSGFRVQGLGLVEVQRSGFTGISEIRTSQSTKQTVSPCRTQYKYSKADPKQDSLYQGPSRPRVAEGLDFGNTPWLLHGGPELESTQH